MTRLRIAALLVLALAAPVTSAERAGPVGVGEMAPDVSLFDQHGRSFHLAEALETRDFVVLAFYVKAFTGG